MVQFPLRIIHTSDWHLGHELAGHPREYEHDQFLDWLLGQIAATDADVLLVTGDVYDVANPPISAMRRLFKFLREATESHPGLQVIILGGNHDSAARIDLPAALLGSGNIHFIGALPRKDGEPDLDRLLIPLRTKAGQVTGLLAAVPFCRAGDLSQHSLTSLYQHVIEHGIAAAQELPLIVTGHLHVAGGLVSELSERRIVVGGEEAQAASLFDARAAYVALGHLHRPQAIKGPTTIRYAGSPFPLSATERNYRHSISVVSLGPDRCSVDEVLIPRPVQFLVLPSTGPKPLDEVIAAIEALELTDDVPREAQPFLEVSVLVDGPEPHLQARILAALDGKPVRLTRIEKVNVNAPQRDALQFAGENLSELQPAAVFDALYRKEHGTSPPSDLVSAFEQLLVETNTQSEEG